MDGWTRELEEERFPASMGGIETYEGLSLNDKLDLFSFEELS